MASYLMTADHDRQPSATGDTTLMPYWERVASRYAASDPLAAVCYPAAPRWFNRFYARFQVRAVARMLGGLRLAGARALDVGCGGGRWTRWLAEHGAEAIGVDPTTAMLETSRRLSPGLTFHRMSATTIDFPADSFDLVMAVTVIQHLRPAEQDQAAAAMCRVVRPGGHLFVFDLIDQRDPGRVVFPRRPDEWIEMYQRQGMTLVRWEGQEYVPLMRALIALLPSQTGQAAESNVTAPSMLERIGARRAAFASLWPVIQLSYPLESLCERLLPATRARHGCFLFRKVDGASPAQQP
jgi:ubiquinone/menaquinone biosynthesis C-methylase UbiE